MERAICKLMAGLLLAVALKAHAIADDATDQFAVAAGHYAAERWPLACEEFQTFLAKHADHEKAPQAKFYLAESLVQSGKLDEARAHFADLLENHPESPLAKRALFRRGEAAFLAGIDGEAETDLSAFQHTYENDELNAYVLPYLGELALRAMEPQQAMEHYSSATKRFPKGPLAEECLFGIARVYEQQGELEKARQEYERLAKDVYAPLADKACLQLATLDNAAGRHADALERLESFREHFKDSALAPQAELARGWTLYKLEKFSAADEVLVSLRDHAELKTESRYWQGMVRAAQQQWEAAIEQFNSADQSTENHRLQPAIVFQTGESLRQLGRLTEAASKFEQLLAKWPNDPYADDAAFGCLQIAVQAEKHQDAVKLATSFLEKYPESSLGVAEDCRSTIAVCHARLGNVADAQRALIELKTNHVQSELIAPTTYKVAEAAFKAGDSDTAKLLFAEVAENSTSAEWKSRGLAGLAWSQMKAEDLAQSATTFETLLKQNPSEPLAATAALMRGQALEKLEQPEAALAMYRRVIEEYPKSRELPQAIFKAAILHDKLHQVNEARTLYRRLVEEQPEFTDRALALFQWGCLEAENGGHSSAADLWQRVRKEYPQSTVAADATYRIAVASLESRKFDDCEEFVNEVLAKTNATHLQPHALYLQSRLAVAREAWDQVAPPLEKLVSTFPDCPLVPTAEFWIAEAAYRRGEYQAAEAHFAQLRSRPAKPEDQWLLMAHLRTAQSLAQLGKWTEAREIAEKLAADFPDFPSCYEADYLIGRAWANDADFEQARTAYNRVVQSKSGGKTETAAMAQWMIGESYFHQEDYTAALRAYLRVEILYAYPRWQAVSLLQAGKCHEQMGQWKEATALYSRLLKTYPNSDVGEEAAERLGIAQQHVTEKRRS